MSDVSMTLPLSVDNCDGVGDGIKAPLVVVVVEGETF